MGENVATLSKMMKGDATAAAEVLTTAMNQYGVSLEDPMEASRQMADMMNIMAAAGREGSAELPTIKVALEQCGMAAKADRMATLRPIASSAAVFLVSSGDSCDSSSLYGDHVAVGHIRGEDTRA